MKRLRIIFLLILIAAYTGVISGCGRRGVRTIAFFNWVVWQYDVPSDADDDAGYELTLDFDPAGIPYISYYNFFGNNLMFLQGTNYRNSSWDFQAINGTSYGTYPCIVVDDSGNVNIIYSDFANNSIEQAQYNPDTGIWEKNTVGLSPAGYLSCAYSVRGWIHVSYINLNDFSLNYITIKGLYETPDFDVLDTGESYVGGTGQLLGSDLALDLNARPHVVYYDAVNGNLKYVSKTSTGEYKTEVVEWEKIIHEPITFAQSREINYYVASLSNPSSGRKEDVTLYAWLPGNDFPTELTDNYWDFYKSVELARIQMSYAIFNSFPSGTTFTITYIRSNSSPHDDGIFSAIAVDNEGIPHVAYFDYTTFDLRYATKLPEEDKWVTELVDGEEGGDMVGGGVDIALTEEGNPFIVYRDIWNNVLKAAVKIDGVWNTGLIYYPQNPQDVVLSGMYPVIKRDPEGNFGVVLREVRRTNGIKKGEVKFLYIIKQ